MRNEYVCRGKRMLDSWSGDLLLQAFFVIWARLLAIMAETTAIYAKTNTNI